MPFSKLLTSDRIILTRLLSFLVIKEDGSGGEGSGSGCDSSSCDNDKDLYFSTPTTIKPHTPKTRASASSVRLAPFSLVLTLAGVALTLLSSYTR